MISVENLKVEFGVKPLFHDVSFVINDRDRIALVGINGTQALTIAAGRGTYSVGRCADLSSRPGRSGS